MAYVYRHIRLDKNEPFYVGIGNSNDNFYRANSKHSRNKIWKSISNKTNYKSEILFDDLTWEEACEKEKEFILIYGKICNNSGILANITDGGEGTIGLEAWNKGKKGLYTHSEESRKKLSKASFGRKLTEEWKRKIGDANRNMSEETKKKLSKINKGNKNFLGKKHKESSKILQSYKKGTKIIDNDNKICHYGITAAAKFLNVSASYLRTQLCGLRENKFNLEIAQIKKGEQGLGK